MSIKSTPTPRVRWLENQFSHLNQNQFRFQQKIFSLGFPKRDNNEKN